MKIKFICEVNIFYECEKEERKSLMCEFIKMIENFGDDVEISFISKIDIVSLLTFMSEIGEVIKEIDSPVSLGYQYGENKIYKRGIIDTSSFGYLGELGNDVFQRGFNKIFFIDNSKIICNIVKGQLLKNSPNSEIITIHPNKKEIFGIQALIEQLKTLQSQRLIRTKNS